MARSKKEKKIMSNATTEISPVQNFAPDTVIVDKAIVARRNPEPVGPQFEELKESIKREGQLQPGRIWVRPTDDGQHEFVIVYGYNRLKACEALGLPFRAEVKTYANVTEARLDAIHENKDRKDANVLDDATNMLALKNSGMKQKDIAEHYGVTSGRVSQMLSLLDLPDTVLGSIAQGELSAGGAEHLVEYQKLLTRLDKKRPPAEKIGDEAILKAVETMLASCEAIIPRATENGIEDTRRYDVAKLAKKVALARSSYEPTAEQKAEDAKAGEGDGAGEGGSETPEKVKNVPSSQVVKILVEMVSFDGFPADKRDDVERVIQFVTRQVTDEQLFAHFGVSRPVEEKPTDEEKTEAAA